MATALAADQISLSWLSGGDKGGTGVGGYRVFRNGVMIGVTRSTSFVDTGLTAATSYAYTVSAYDKASPTNSGLPTSPAVTATTLRSAAGSVTSAARDGVNTHLGLSSRSHIADLDAARGVLMLLGLVLHSADVYRVGRWVVHDPSGNVAFDWLVTAIHLFRMPAFFWISGFFAALSLDRAVPTDFFKRRFQRLVYPMVATMLSFNLLQQVVLDYLPPENVKQPTAFAHLWFLVDLLIYSTLAALVMTKGGRLDRALTRLLHGVRRPALLICILAVTTAIPILGVAVLGKFAGHDLALGNVTSLERLAANAVYFIVGMVSYRSRPLRDVLHGIHPIWFLPAVGIGVWVSQVVRPGFLVQVLLEGMLVWVAVGAILSFFRQAFSQPSSFRLWLADASYPIYLSHHFFVILFAGLLLTSSLAAPVKFALVLGSDVSLQRWHSPSWPGMSGCCTGCTWADPCRGRRLMPRRFGRSRHPRNRPKRAPAPTSRGICRRRKSCGICAGLVA